MDYHQGMENMSAPKLYNQLAPWWPLLSPVADYAEEAAFFLQTMRKAGLPSAPALLELGAGGGSNAFHLKPHFAQMTLTDLSPQMLTISQTFNPECEHLQGDMRTLRLGRAFDVVFIHDAIDYMLTLQELRQALETAAIHCKPGGLGFFAPDFVRETFQPSTDHGGTDGDGRSLRYLEWTYDPDASDSTYITEFAYLLREGDKTAQVEHDIHTCGLFARADWIRLLQEAGFQPEVIRDPFARELLLARKAGR
jgi:ubiquinone/menaquinone biosynthesis C-methylase UbiE